MVYLKAKWKQGAEVPGLFNCPVSAPKLNSLAFARLVFAPLPPIDARILRLERKNTEAKLGIACSSGSSCASKRNARREER